MKKTFEDICHDGKCEVCGKEGKVAVLASGIGAGSFAYCKDCASRGLEPYGAIIAIYSSIGMTSAEDFANKNEKVLKEFYHKSKEEFLNECGEAEKKFNEQMEAYMKMQEEQDNGSES